MRSVEQAWSGWRGVCLVAITYVYFLIFAQFAFLKRLADLGIADAHLKSVLAAMAVGGVLLSLLSPRIEGLPSGRRRLQAAFAVCASAAFASLLPLGLITAAAVSFLIGSGLGLLTVTLVTNLRSWVGLRHPLLCVGLGTGIGYFLCNFPPLFNATPQAQALVSALLCLAGIAIAGRRQHTVLEEETSAKVAIQGTPFLAALASFTALVWLDSAAFFIIQNTPALKAGTWGGAQHLWTNAGLHLLGALASVWLLRRRGLPTILLLALAFLGTACLLLLHPANALAASVLYPIGVSLYSVALVAYPSLMSRAATAAQRGRQAGWIYASPVGSARPWVLAWVSTSAMFRPCSY